MAESFRDSNTRRRSRARQYGRTRLTNSNLQWDSNVRSKASLSMKSEEEAAVFKLISGPAGFAEQQLDKQRRCGALSTCSCPRA